ncbi:MAG: CDP-alcohol phosphatidyltransferase family protein [Simkaniaceae bacterium]|nr:CDP-alcohol phosphatidyltransferase family protein [Simkaniaceae bacterium]
MLTISNSLTFLRGPLAFLLLIESVSIRIVAIALAMLTDCVDGYFARKYSSASRFGAILDPIMDKFFVIFALCIFFSEDQLSGWQAGVMLSRDVVLFFFISYLVLTQSIKSYKFRSVLWGKITTSMQFLFLILLSIGCVIPAFFYYFFVLFSMLVLFELVKIKKQSRITN